MPAATGRSAAAGPGLMALREGRGRAPGNSDPGLARNVPQPDPN